MSRPDRNENDNPMAFFQKKDRPDPLAQISDQKIREDAAAAIAARRALAEKDLATRRTQVATSNQRWESALDSMSAKNPIRIVGELLYARVQASHNRSFFSIAEKSWADEDKIIQQARIADTHDGRTYDDRKGELQKLQIQEYVDRYHPDLGTVSVEIDPSGTLASVHKEPIQPENSDPVAEIFDRDADVREARALDKDKGRDRS